MRYINKEVLANTNNAWGFGGYKKTEYEYPNHTVRIKTERFYRHAPSSVHNDWYDEYGDELTYSEFCELRDEWEKLAEDNAKKLHEPEPKPQQKELDL